MSNRTREQEISRISLGHAEISPLERIVALGAAVRHVGWSTEAAKIGDESTGGEDVAVLRRYRLVIDTPKTARDSITRRMKSQHVMTEEPGFAERVVIAREVNLEMLARLNGHLQANRK